jgi:2-polyprenyl-6-methoxyphenol hydroxylase-like FAD-dependent oxidoreductase
MNLAIQDPVELAHGFIECFGPGSNHRRLSARSRTRLRHIWRTQAFSNWHLHLILTSLQDGQEPPAAVPGGFAHGLRQGWISALQNDPPFARWFGHTHADVHAD